ncbi:MAG: hypothetical protein LBH59_04775, partial [Planctomycetaceae bacterium]|nr:hypothetical protein [Planctomycetaceae bacterium]
MYNKTFNNLFNVCRIFPAILFWATIQMSCFAADNDGLIGIWSFDEVSEKTIKNSANEKFNAISQNP